MSKEIPLHPQELADLRDEAVTIVNLAARANDGSLNVDNARMRIGIMKSAANDRGVLSKLDQLITEVHSGNK